MSNTGKDAATMPWADCPMVFVTLPACPACGCPSYITIRSEQNGDNSMTRKSVCRRCSTRFKIVAELPSFGKDQLDTY